MARKPQTEALVPVEVLPPEPVADSLEELVQRKVAEALAQKDSAIFQPWFATRSESEEIRRRQTVPERKKWAAYYERFGCAACKTRKRPHASCGLCAHCRAEIGNRLKDILRDLRGEKEKPFARACDICGQQFRPMFEAVWQNNRALHEGGNRHKRAVALLKKGMRGR